jgi:hypothetical protein
MSSGAPLCRWSRSLWRRARQHPIRFNARGTKSALLARTGQEESTWAATASLVPRLYIEN